MVANTKKEETKISKILLYFKHDRKCLTFDLVTKTRYFLEDCRTIENMQKRLKNSLLWKLKNIIVLYYKKLDKMLSCFISYRNTYCLSIGLLLLCIIKNNNLWFILQLRNFIKQRGLCTYFFKHWNINFLMQQCLIRVDYGGILQLKI